MAENARTAATVDASRTFFKRTPWEEMKTRLVAATGAWYRERSRRRYVLIIFFSMPTPAATARSYSSGTVAES